MGPRILDMPPGMGRLHTTKNSPTPDANGDELEEAKHLTEVRRLRAQVLSQAD